MSPFSSSGWANIATAKNFLFASLISTAGAFREAIKHETFMLDSRTQHTTVKLPTPRQTVRYKVIKKIALSSILGNDNK
jgi:hypothetical protein